MRVDRLNSFNRRYRSCSRPRLIPWFFLLPPPTPTGEKRTGCYNADNAPARRRRPALVATHARATTTLDLGSLPPELVDAVLQRSTLRSLTRLALTNQPWCELVTAHLLQESKPIVHRAPTSLLRACRPRKHTAGNEVVYLFPLCAAVHDALDACERGGCVPDALASSMRERIPSREERLTDALVAELQPALLDLVRHTEETAQQLYIAVGLRLSPAVFIEVATKLWASQKVCGQPWAGNQARCEAPATVGTTPSAVRWPPLTEWD